MDTSVFSDPVKVGPGIWFKMHIDGVEAITDPLKEAFIVNTNATCDNFKCKKCQPHFRKFIDTHPLEKYWYILDSKDRDIGFFQWTWELHNQVNRFLKKYEPTLEEAYEFYANSEAGACFNCGSQSDSSVRDNSSQESKVATQNQSSSLIGFNNQLVPDQISRAIPPILTLYRESGEIKPQPFKLIHRT